MKKLIFSLFIALLVLPIFSVKADQQDVAKLFSQYGFTASQQDISWWSQNTKNQWGDLEYNLARRAKLAKIPTTTILNQDNIGATIPQVVALFETSLQGKITSSATEMTLVDGTDKIGTSLSGTYGFIISEGASNEEFVQCTCTGTACTSCLRGLSVTTGNTEVTALKKDHRRGESVKLTDFPILGILSRILNGQVSLPNTLFYETSPTSAASSTAIMDKSYIDGVAISGGADASASIKGISKLSVNPVSAVNPIAVGDNDNRVPPVDSSSITAGKLEALAGTSGTPGSGNKYVTNDDTAENTASKLVRRTSGGEILGISTFVKSMTAGETIVANDVITLKQHSISIPSDDAGLHEASPSSNYGSDQQVLFGRGGGGSGDDNYVAVKWNIASLPSAVDKAEIIWYTEGAAGWTTASSITRVTSADWAEGTINWGNQPTGTDIFTAQTFTTGYNVFDITSTYNGWKDSTYQNYGLILKAEGTNAVNFETSEHPTSAIRPILVLTTSEAKAYKVDPTSTYETGGIVGIAKTGGALDESISVTIGGVVSGLSGLETGSTYYLADAGTLTATPATLETKLGKAVSTTELLLDIGEHEYIGTATSQTGGTAEILVPRGATRATVLVYGTAGTGHEMQLLRGYKAAAGIDNNGAADDSLGATWNTTGTSADIINVSVSTGFSSAQAWFFR